MPDCLICLETTHDTWYPQTLCMCRPNMHKSCWKQWTFQAGNMCIICRETIQEQETPVYIDYRETFNYMYLFQAFVITLLFLAAVNQHSTFQFRVRDEL